MKWHVTATVRISVHTNVEADSKEEAVRIAEEERTFGEIQDGDCFGQSADEYWLTSGAIDGDVIEPEAEKFDEDDDS